ncbi:hypothetical protein LINGRAHAP2_LOCUS31426, partial [Linum grandiflorum]
LLPRFSQPPPPPRRRRRRRQPSPQPPLFFFLSTRRRRRLRGSPTPLRLLSLFSVLGATATATRRRRPSDSSSLSPTRAPQDWYCVNGGGVLIMVVD